MNLTSRGPRANALAEHPEAPVRKFTAETIKEIEIFVRSEAVTAMSSSTGAHLAMQSGVAHVQAG